MLRSIDVGRHGAAVMTRPGHDSLHLLIGQSPFAAVFLSCVLHLAHGRTKRGYSVGMTAGGQAFFAITTAALSVSHAQIVSAYAAESTTTATA